VDPTYLPLYIGNYVLGGNFSARLMTVIRDELGLTYGIRSALSDVDVLHHGIWSISVTLAHENLERGISETLRQAREFVSGGVSDSELREKKTTITGSFKVGLSSTGAIAGALLRNAEKGRLPEYFDRFPALVDALTVDRVNETISENFDPDQLHVALAGSLRNK
jgi:predicted Zn-dependent peptidase